MKKLLLIILSLVTAIFFAGCSFITTPDPSADKKPGVVNPDDGGDDEEEGLVFTVKLVYNNASYYPTQKVVAQWIGEEGVYSAEFNVFGVAKITGLDGDYRVNLASAPAGYTYDPNNHYADNDNPNITIELLKLNIPPAYVGNGSLRKENGDGKKINEAIEFSELGTYRATLDTRESYAYFQYKPVMGGSYVLESWVDIVNNEVNPILERYNSNAGGTNYHMETSNEGGSASTFTKNFRMEINLTNAESNGNIWKFAIHADVRDATLYPVIVDFTIRYVSDYEDPTEPLITINAEGPFATAEWWAKNPTNGRSCKFVFEDTNNIMTIDHPLGKIMLNEEDGFYYFYNVQKGFVKPVYVVLGRDSPMIQTLEEGDPLGMRGTGFTDDMVLLNLKFGGMDYCGFMAKYKTYLNSDGLHPVNEELKLFLQRFAIEQWIFKDGDGTAEEMGFQSDDENMWLLACAYYR